MLSCPSGGFLAQASHSRHLLTGKRFGLRPGRWSTAIGDPTGVTVFGGVVSSYGYDRVIRRSPH